VPVKRDGHDAAGVKAALCHLKAGKPLGIFIEGGIPNPGEEVSLKDGAALLALKTGATVIPACVVGTRHHPSVLASFFRRHNGRVRFGKPLDLSGFRQSRPTRETYRAVTGVMADAIEALQAETQAA